MDGYRFTIEQKVVWRDLDAMGHVNNAVYASYLENGRLGYFDQLADADVTLTNLILAEQTISYRSPATLRDMLVIGVRVAEIRNSSFILESQIEEQSTGRLVATSRSVAVHYDYGEGRSTPVPTAWREAMSAFEGRPLG